MKRILSAAILGLSLMMMSPAAPIPGEAAAYAQEFFNLQQSLKRLKANPRYRGKVLGTRIVRSSDGQLVEVRILRPNDRIVIVYIDPQTGGVVRESRR